ncbi:MAG: hypothetical protein HYW89_01980 [Candidatus Sungiibacteriota bacterium]|uniref:Uncharacterized protein n=1 Tax=Candidatus Sungiibacteriota bacterium TaxID=2750080 RepID=A0A7T5RK71_9BACT|nr:MAG: hypothetical protein HYW89_01980 [Candidatus Sungbacteria bacterium]
MARRSRRRRLPLSGNQHTDWEFRKIVDIVENVFEIIRKKRFLRDPDDRRKRLLGFLSLAVHEGERTQVYVGHNKENPPAKNLIHEALHALYNYTDSRGIGLEEVLSKEDITKLRKEHCLGIARKLLHILIRHSRNRCLHHSDLDKKEVCLWRIFTDAQKRYLRNRIPRHEAKKDPPKK